MSNDTNSTTAMSAEAIRERRAKITEAPWTLYLSGHISADLGGDHPRTIAVMVFPQDKQSVIDGRFIANAPTDIDFLLAANERLRGEVEAAKKAAFSKGVEEGRATQAILELQGRDRFIEDLKTKIIPDELASLRSQLAEWKSNRDGLIEAITTAENETVRLSEQLTDCKQKTWAAAIEAVKGIQWHFDCSGERADIIAALEAVRQQGGGGSNGRIY